MSYWPLPRGVFFTILQHLVKAGWSVTVRRLAEGIAANLSWLWVLFIPIFVLVVTGHGGAIFPWATPEAAHDHLLHQKASYLNTGFWAIRAIVFFLIWGLLARYYFRLSKKQDLHGEVKYTNRLQWFAPVAMILYALTQTFASYDWIMSLQPKWFSTMFGVYFFAVSATGFFSSIIVLIWFLREAAECRDHPRAHPRPRQAARLRRRLLGVHRLQPVHVDLVRQHSDRDLVVLPRHLGEWYWVSVILINGHFVLPFLLLISRWPKRWKAWSR